MRTIEVTVTYIDELLGTASADPPTRADLVQVVRCRECYYFTDSPAWPDAHECDYINRGVEPDGFCAWAERRADHD